MKLGLSLGLAGQRRHGSSIPLPVFTVGPTISGNPNHGETLTCAVTATGTGTVSYAYDWRKGGVTLGAANQATYTVQITDDGTTITCRVTATDDNGTRSATSNSLPITYPQPVISAQPTMTPSSVAPAGEITLDLGTASDSTGVIDYFTLDGSDVSGDLVGLVYTGSTEGVLALRVAYTNSGGTTYSNVISGAVNTLPEISAFSATTDTISFTASEPCDVYYLVNSTEVTGATTVIAGGGEASGSYPVDEGANSTPIDFSAIGNGDYWLHVVLVDGLSGVSAVTTSAFIVASEPAQFAGGAWSVADAGTSGDITITITTLPDDGNSAITDLEYQIDAGSWVSMAGTTTGAYAVAGLTDDVEVDVAIRAVNAIGNGTASTTKAVTPTASAPAGAVGYIGAVTYNAIGSTSADTRSLTALTGGSASAPVEGDMVIVSVAVGTSTGSGQTTWAGPSGYTPLLGSGGILSNSNQRFAILWVGYKIMGATPDTTVDIPGSQHSSDGKAEYISVWSGVDASTIAASVASVLNTYTAIADPPSVTPTISGSYVLAVGGGGVDGGDYTSSDLSDFRADFANDSNDATIGGGYIAWTSGAVDPAAFGFTGSDNSFKGAAAMSLVLEPA